MIEWQTSDRTKHSSRSASSSSSRSSISRFNTTTNQSLWNTPVNVDWGRHINPVDMNEIWRSEDETVFSQLDD